MIGSSVLFEEATEAVEATAETVYASEIFQPVAIWMTVGVVAALVFAVVAMMFVDRAAVGKFAKIVVLGFAIYAAVIGIVLLALEIAKNYSVSYAEENYLARADLITHVLVPIIIILAIVLVSAVLLSLLGKYKKSALRIASFICGAAFVAALVVAAVLIGMFYSEHIAEDGYYNSDVASVNNVVLYVGAGVLIVLVIALAFIFDRNGRKGFDTNTIAYAAICVALSYALSYVRIIHMPQGGSLTLASLLPLMVFSYMFGTKKGVFVGFIYGILQAIQDPFIIHPAQFLLDYPVAFSFIGLAGMFAKFKPLDKLPQVKFALGAAVACIGRYVSHVLSGVFAFSAYAADANIDPWPYSLAYNSFVFLDLLIVMVAGILLFSSRNFVRLASSQNTPVPHKSGTDATSQESADGSVTSDGDGLADADPAAKHDKRA